MFSLIFTSFLGISNINNYQQQERAIHCIKELIGECKQYSKSMIIFDLDSVAEIHEEYSSLKAKMTNAVSLQDGANPFSYRITR